MIGRRFVTVASDGWGPIRPLSYIWVDVASSFGALVRAGGKPFTLSGCTERSNRMSRLGDPTGCNLYGGCSAVIQKTQPKSSGCWKEEIALSWSSQQEVQSTQWYGGQLMYARWSALAGVLARWLVIQYGLV